MTSDTGELPMILIDSLTGPYISQFLSDQKQPLVGLGGAEAPGLTIERKERRTEVIILIQSGHKTLFFYIHNTLIKICNLLKLTSDTCTYTMRLFSRWNEVLVIECDRCFLHFIVCGWSGVVFAATLWAWTWCWVSKAKECEEKQTLNSESWQIVNLYSLAKKSRHTQLCWIIPIRVFPYISLFGDDQELTSELLVESCAAPPELWQETERDKNSNYWFRTPS